MGIVAGSETQCMHILDSSASLRGTCIPLAQLRNLQLAQCDTCLELQRDLYMHTMPECISTTTATPTDTSHMLRAPLQVIALLRLCTASMRSAPALTHPLLFCDAAWNTCLVFAIEQLHENVVLARPLQLCSVDNLTCTCMGCPSLSVRRKRGTALAYRLPL